MTLTGYTVRIDFGHRFFFYMQIFWKTVPVKRFLSANICYGAGMAAFGFEGLSRKEYEWDPHALTHHTQMVCDIQRVTGSQPPLGSCRALEVMTNLLSSSSSSSETEISTWRNSITSFLISYSHLSARGITLSFSNFPTAFPNLTCFAIFFFFTVWRVSVTVLC